MLAKIEFCQAPYRHKFIGKFVVQTFIREDV